MMVAGAVVGRRQPAGTIDAAGQAAWTRRFPEIAGGSVHAMVAVSLVSMSGPDLEAFIRQEIVDHADQRVHDGIWERTEALERSRGELTTVVSWERHAANVADQRLWTAIDEDGRRIGWMWVKLCSDQDGVRRAFLCQMTVHHDWRRHGYGRAMLAALEAKLGTDGYAALSLNVEESNLPAKHLYESAGYALVRQYPTMRQLSKCLHGPALMDRTACATSPSRSVTEMTDRTFNLLT